RALSFVDATDDILKINDGAVQVDVKRIVVKELADRALPLVDAVHQFLKLFADGVELREDVVSALKDGGEARLIGARNLAAGRDWRVLAGARRNVEHAVAEEALLRQHNLRIVADAIFHGLGIQAHADDDGLVV